MVLYEQSNKQTKVIRVPYLVEVASGIPVMMKHTYIHLFILYVYVGKL